MNKLTKKILAAIAASVMTVTAVCPSAYAITPDNTVADGWVKEGSIERRYIDGLPYTGWLNYDDGSKKYCLDGYIMTGKYIIDGKSYSFGKDGTVSKNTAAVPDLSAECGEVNPDTSKIEFTLYVNNNDGKMYTAGDPVKMQRWEKGKWVDCKDKNVSYGYDADHPKAVFSYQIRNKLSFYPQVYTSNNFRLGYYRMTFSAGDAADSKSKGQTFYSYFEVTPKNIYKDGFVNEGTRTRRYSKGTPYTGWSYVADGSRKYYLDGYLMTGELQIDNIIYTFNDEGVCINKSYPALSASCGGKVSSDAEKVGISIYSNINNYEEYYAADPTHVMRWEYGRWAECKSYSSEYITDDCLAVITYSKSDQVHFYPQRYTGNNFIFSPGYYKVDLSAWGTKTGVSEKFSTVFEVVSYTVVKDGWVNEGGKERRYKSGSPYTGWIENTNGTRKYCHDGYAVTGDFQIGKYIYTFNADGIYTGISRKLVVTASCGKVIASDTRKLIITVTNSGADGKTYSVGRPYKMERWENGKWVDCIGNGVQFLKPDIAAFIYAKASNERSTFTKMDFYPQDYTAGSFTPGYYRIAFSCRDQYNTVWQDVYAMFEVV